MNSQEIKIKYNLKYKPDIYTRPISMNNYMKPHTMIMGLDCKYWVVCPADAERLYNAGFEYHK